MAEQRNKTSMIFARVDKEVHRKWMAKAVRYGVPSAVLRELILAFIDGRLTIKPPPDYIPETKESLYNAGN